MPYLFKLSAAAFLVGIVCMLLWLLFGYEQDVLTIRTEAIDLVPHEHIVTYDSVSDTGHHHNVVSPVIRAPRDLWVTKIEAVVENASPVTLHHASLFRIDGPDLECPNHYGESVLTFAQDQMHTPYVEFPEGYGIFIPKDTPLQLAAMFHNPEPPVGPGEEYYDVQVGLRLHLAEDIKQDMKHLRFHLLRLTDSPCVEDATAARVFAVPPETEGYVFSGTGEKGDTAQMTFTKPARIVHWGAHIHGWEGGRNVTLYKNGEPIQVFSAEQSLDEPYRYDVPHMDTDLIVESGDVLSIESTYDNPVNAVLRGAMGQMGMYVADE